MTKCDDNGERKKDDKEGMEKSSKSVSGMATKCFWGDLHNVFIGWSKVF